MRINIFIFLAFSFLLIQNGYGQDIEVAKTDSTAKIDGQIFLIHSVKAKQTLFSIAKTYEVKLSRIAFDNPGVLDGLKLGQYLRILESAQGETKESEIVAPDLGLEGEYVLYKVPRRQTLYSIAKEYNTTVSAILDANPELADGLKVRMIIRIPVPKILDAQEKQRVEMIGLPDIIRREEKLLEEDEMVPTNWNVTLLLPLYLDLNDTTEATRLSEETEKIYDKSEIALEFYEGVLLALDTLHAAGYNVKLKVIDTDKRPWKVRQLVAKQELKNADLIIGPFYSKVFTEVANYAYQNCIPLVSPTIKGSSIIANNPYVFRLIPSEKSMIFDMGRYLADSDSTNNMILHYGAVDEMDLFSHFKQGLNANGTISADFPSYNIYKTGTDSIRNKLSLTRRNNLVILSNNQVKLARLVRKILTWTEDAYIVGYVPSKWKRFKNLEIDHFDQLRVHMPTAFHVDYDQIAVQEFVQKFRLKFSGEPSSFAFRGYDVAMHFIRNLDGIKTNDVEYMQSVQEVGLQSEFGWKKLPDGGFENTRPRIVDYTGLNLKIATD